MVIIQRKHCPTCGTLKLTTEFGHSRRGKTFQWKAYCRSCASVKVSNKDSARRATDPVYRERKAAIRSASYRRHSATANASQREYERRHPEVRRTVKVNRRARERGAQGRMTTAEWEQIKAAHGHRCAKCGKARKLTRDHIVPLSVGGQNTADNIQPLCGPCNSSKGTKMTDYRHWPEGTREAEQEKLGLS